MWVREEKEPDAQRWREVGEQRWGQGAGQRKQRRREKWGVVQREMETHRSERPRDQGERVRLEAEELGLETQQFGWRRQRPKECTAEGHSGTPAPCCVQGCQRPRSEPSHGSLSESRPGPAPAGMLLGWTPCWGLWELREKGAHGVPWGRTASSPLRRGGDLGGDRPAPLPGCGQRRWGQAEPLPVQT